MHFRTTVIRIVLFRVANQGESFLILLFPKLCPWNQVWQISFVHCSYSRGRKILPAIVQLTTFGLY